MLNFPPRNFAPGSRKNDDRQLGRPTAFPLLSLVRPISPAGCAPSFVPEQRILRFYQAEFAFEQGGLSGLLPQKRGPRNGHKLTPEVMKFVAEQQALQSSLSFAQLAEQVQHNFHVKVHPRSIERQLQREKNSDKFAARSHCRTARERWIDCRVRRTAASDPECTAGTRVGVIYATGHEGMDECLFASPRTASNQRIYCRT